MGGEQVRGGGGGGGGGAEEQLGRSVGASVQLQYCTEHNKVPVPCKGVYRFCSVFVLCASFATRVHLKHSPFFCFVVKGAKTETVARTTRSAAGQETTSLIRVTEERLGKGLLRWL